VKAMVAADLVGLAGLVHWDGGEDALMPRPMTVGANPAGRGAFAGAATAIFAAQSHGNRRNLLPEALEPGIAHVSG